MELTPEWVTSAYTSKVVSGFCLKQKKVFSTLRIWFKCTCNEAVRKASQHAHSTITTRESPFLGLQPLMISHQTFVRC